MKGYPTKKLATTLTNECKTIGYTFNYEPLTPDEYSIYIGYSPEYYIMDNGKLRAIRVVYPPEYHAVDNWITTDDIQHWLRKCDRTIKGFIKVMLNDIEI